MYNFVVFEMFKSAENNQQKQIEKRYKEISSDINNWISKDGFYYQLMGPFGYDQSKAAYLIASFGWEYCKQLNSGEINSQLVSKFLVDKQEKAKKVVPEITEVMDQATHMISVKYFEMINGKADGDTVESEIKDIVKYFRPKLFEVQAKNDPRIRNTIELMDRQ